MAVDYKALKKGGLMRQRQKDCFSMRLKSVGGHFTAKQLDTIQKAAEKYGEGYVHLTSRQGIEIPFIKLQDIDAVKADLKQGGVEVGVCGPRVRTITACQGAAVCPSGLIDTAPAWRMNLTGATAAGSFRISSSSALRAVITTA